MQTEPPKFRRPDMVVCRTCRHFQEKQRGVHVRMNMRGRPPVDARKECVWFQTEEGRRASEGERLAVMVAGANGGRGCERTRR